MKEDHPSGVDGRTRGVGAAKARASVLRTALAGVNSSSGAAQMSSRGATLATHPRGEAAGGKAELRSVDVECSLSCDNDALMGVRSKVTEVRHLKLFLWHQNFYIVVQIVNFHK